MPKKNVTKFSAGVAGILLLLTAAIAHAYEPTTTHAALTDEIVDFYNLFVTNPDDKITDEEKEWIVKGTVEEDTPPRWVNHFYDPVYNRGWLGLAPTSKEWAQSVLRESLFILTTNGIARLSFWQGVQVSSDYTWGRGIKDFVKGDHQRSMEVLGHVLHLMEDATVPEHTRNDTHISSQDTYGIVQHADSPYEGWATRYTRGTLNVATQLKGDGLQSIKHDNLDAYFEGVATYTNGHYVSEDTIFSSEYLKPEVVSISQEQEDEKPTWYGYGTDEDGSKIKLFKALYDYQTRNVFDKSQYTVRDDAVLDNYFSRLSKKAILNGAGMTQLYFDEIKKAQREEADRLARWNTWFASMVGTVQSTWSSMTSTAQNAWSSMASFFSFSDIYPGIQQSANLAGITLNTVATTFSTGSNNTALPSPSDIATEEPTVSGTVLGESVSPTPIESQESGITNQDSGVGNMALGIGNSSAEPTVSPTFQPTAFILVSGSNRGTVVSSGGSTPIATNGGGVSASAPSSTPEPSTPSPSSTTSTVPTPSPTPVSDTTPPDVAFTMLPRSVTTSTIALTWHSDAGDVASYDLEFSFGELGNHTTTGGTWIPLLQETNATATVFTAPQNEATYHFRLRARDMTGNVSAWQELWADVSTKPVAINEIAWMGTNASADDEWIELANKTGESISVLGWTLRVTSHNDDRDITLTGIVQPRGYYLLERAHGSTTLTTSDETVSDLPADQIFTASLADRDTTLTLLDAGGVEMDTTPRGSAWAAGDNTSKATMERIRPDGTGVDSFNWFTNNGRVINGLDATGTPILGTPKAQNSVFNIYTSAKPQQFLATDAIWKKSQSPYYIPQSLYVEQGATLTIEAGTVVKMGENTFLDVAGTLRAEGTASDPVVFTAFTDDEVLGDTNQDATATTPAIPYWQWIRIHAPSTQSVISHTIIRYAGTQSGPVADRSSAHVTVEDTDAVFDHVTFEKGYKNGLRLINANSHVSDSTFAGFTSPTVSVPCEQFGGEALLVVGGSPVIERNVIDNAVRGMRFCAATPVVRGNIIRNTQVPLYLAGSLGELRNNTVEHAGEYGISMVGTLTQSGTLTRDTVPYVLEWFRQDAASIITVEPGVVCKVRPGNGANVNIEGMFTARGTETDPIIFTDLADDSAGGDTNADATATQPTAGSWYTMTIAPSSTAACAATNFRYGGGASGGDPSSWTMLHAQNSALLTFENVEIAESKSNGVLLESASTETVSFTHAIFTHNANAGMYLRNASPTLTDVLFEHNRYGIYAEGAGSHPIATDVRFDGNMINTVPADLLGP